jgi:hypothetical protein
METVSRLWVTVFNLLNSYFYWKPHQRELRSVSKTQQTLYKMIYQLFHNQCTIIMNYRHPDLLSLGGKFIEYDVSLPYSTQL